MHSHEIEPAELSVSNSDWVMVKSENRTNHFSAQHQEYFMVWVSETPPSTRITEASKTLAEMKNPLPGIHINCQLEPELGFILRTTKNWHLETLREMQLTFDKITWEIDRLSQR